MDSLTLKIHSFMNHVGSATPTTNTSQSTNAFESNALESNALEMVRYFEEEYDLQMMSFLEKEWVDEQVDRDLSYGEFSDLRNQVPASRLSGFDAIVTAVCEQD